MPRSSSSARDRSRSTHRAASRSRSRSPHASRSHRSRRARSISPYQKKPTTFFKFNATTNEFRKLQMTNDDYYISIEGVRGSSVKRVIEKMHSAYSRNESDAETDIYTDYVYDWLVHAYLVKCREHESVAKQLNATDGRVIVYCDPNDTLLSCGLANDDKDVDNPAKWKGKNLLGTALMQVRCTMKEEWKADHLDSKGKYIFKKNN